MQDGGLIIAPRKITMPSGYFIEVGSTKQTFKVKNDTITCVVSRIKEESLGMYYVYSMYNGMEFLNMMVVNGCLIQYDVMDFFD